MNLYSIIVQFESGDGTVVTVTTPNITLQNLPNVIAQTDDLGSSLLSVQRQCGRIPEPELIPA